MFTLADAPPVEELGYELPIEATRPMEDCYNKLQAAVTAGTFVINVSNSPHDYHDHIFSSSLAAAMWVWLGKAGGRLELRVWGLFHIAW